VINNSNLVDNNFINGSRVVSVEMFNELDEKILNSDRLKNIFTIIPQNKFPLFIKHFLD
jgi:hypothetical protein